MPDPIGTKRMTDLTRAVLELIPDDFVPGEEIIAKAVDLVPPGQAMRAGRAARAKSIHLYSDDEIIRVGKRTKVLDSITTLTLGRYIEKTRQSDSPRSPFMLRKAKKDGGDKNSFPDSLVSVTEHDVASVEIKHVMIGNQAYVTVSLGDLNMVIPAHAASKLGLRLFAQSSVAERALSQHLQSASAAN